MKLTLADVQKAIGEYLNERTFWLDRVSILELENKALAAHNERLRDNRTINQKLNDARDLLVEWGWIKYYEAPKGKCRRCGNPLDVLNGKVCCSNGSCLDYKWTQV